MTLVEQLADVIRGGTLASREWRDQDVEAFCAAAEQHGVLPLVAERMATAGAGLVRP